MTDGSVHVNFSIDKRKYPKVFDALRKWKQDRAVISNKICLAIEKTFQEESSIKERVN